VTASEEEGQHRPKKRNIINDGGDEAKHARPQGSKRIEVIDIDVLDEPDREKKGKHARHQLKKAAEVIDSDAESQTANNYLPDMPVDLDLMRQLDIPANLTETPDFERKVWIYASMLLINYLL
jgi:hypothetical protein